VARLLDGEKMAVLCREFDISRKTGYKIFSRYKDCGMQGLTDRSRRPNRHANRLPFQVEKLIVQLKQEHTSWGAPKIREKLRRLHTEISLPAISTVHVVLDRHGLVSRGRRERYKAQGTVLEQPVAPNDLWCADYKGEFMLTDRRYCYPLTITDATSRYLLCCDALESTKEEYAFAVFERTFKDFGLPQAIRTDNGIPFASRSAFFGLSKLSVWWLRLGIRIERIKPGNPQQNGRHERMHRKVSAKHVIDSRAKDRRRTRSIRSSSNQAAVARGACRIGLTFQGSSASRAAAVPAFGSSSSR
jgi:putative transposase